MSDILILVWSTQNKISYCFILEMQANLLILLVTAICAEKIDIHLNCKLVDTQMSLILEKTSRVNRIFNGAIDASETNAQNNPELSITDCLVDRNDWDVGVGENSGTCRIAIAKQAWTNWKSQWFIQYNDFLAEFSNYKNWKIAIENVIRPCSAQCKRESQSTAPPDQIPTQSPTTETTNAIPDTNPSTTGQPTQELEPKNAIHLLAINQNLTQQYDTLKEIIDNFRTTYESEYGSNIAAETYLKQKVPDQMTTMLSTIGKTKQLMKQAASTYQRLYLAVVTKSFPIALVEKPNSIKNKSVIISYNLSTTCDWPITLTVLPISGKDSTPLEIFNKVMSEMNLPKLSEITQSDLIKYVMISISVVTLVISIMITVGYIIKMKLKAKKERIKMARKRLRVAHVTF